MQAEGSLFFSRDKVHQNYTQPRIRRRKQCEQCAPRVTASTFVKTRLERVARLRMKRHYLS